MTFKIYTLGCKVNSYESQALRERLLKEGYQEAKGKEADIYFVNTCAVTNEAERKDLQKVRSISKDYPNHPIAVMGCSSQIHKEKFISIPGVVAVVGSSGKKEIECLLEEKKGDVVNSDSRHFSYEDILTTKGEGNIRGYLKVQDGCDNFCSYCVVPFTRGNSRSRNHESILKEAKLLLQNGIHELIVSGIDVGSYKDPNDANYSLTSLLNDLVQIEGFDYRIRVSSIEASQITEEYVKLFAKYPNRLCPHFHMPLQSGSERILHLMNRKYTMKEFQAKLDLVRSYLPDVAFSCDVITGFPSETEEDFLLTYDFLKDNVFMRIHAFPYSERPFTRAARMEGSIPQNIRNERTKKLIDLSGKLDQAYRKKLSGKECQILIEEKDKNGLYCGYSENYLRFEIPSEENLVGQFIFHKIVDFKD